MWRYLLDSILCSLLVTAFYERLMDSQYRGFAVKAMGPAIGLVWHHLDPNCYLRSSCHLEELAANVFLYAIWIWVLMCISLFFRYLISRLRR
jgi:hypothetical protein